MSISKEAIEAAAAEICDWDNQYAWKSLGAESPMKASYEDAAERSLTAAAPYMEAALLRRIEVQAFIIAERDKELMQIQGPCRAPGCGLHRAHNGPCTIREGKTK